MKKIIKGLYIAFFEKEYNEHRERFITELQSENAELSRFLVISEGEEIPDNLTQARIDRKVALIKESQRVQTLFKDFI